MNVLKSMNRRDFFKKASITSLGLIFAPAVAKVLVEAEAEEIPQVRCGEGLWAYVQKNGVTHYYSPRELPPVVYHNYEPVFMTGTEGLKALTKAMDHNQMTWLKLQATLENEKN